MNIVVAHKSKQIVKIFSEADSKGSDWGTYMYYLWTSLEHQEASSDTYMTKLTQRLIVEKIETQVVCSPHQIESGERIAGDDVGSQLRITQGH